jgi:Domain of unknown function (DUF4116)
MRGIVVSIVPFNKFGGTLGGTDLPTKPGLSMTIKSEKGRSWTSFFSKHHIALKVGTLFTAIVVVGLGFAMSGGQNSGIVNKETGKVGFQRKCELFISGEEELLKLMKNDPFGGHFYCATTELRNNQKFLLALLKNNFLMPDYINPEFLNDKKFMLAAGDIQRHMFRSASKELKGDKEFVLHAIEHGNLSLHLNEISEELQSDKEIMCAAFKKYPLKETLNLVDQKLMDDEEFMLSVSKCDDAAPAVVLQSASSRLKVKEEFVLSVLSTTVSSYSYEFVCKELKTKQEFILSYLKTHLHLFKSIVPEELKSNSEFIKKAREIPGMCSKDGVLCSSSEVSVDPFFSNPYKRQ